jgi:dynein light intermediate chain 2
MRFLAHLYGASLIFTSDFPAEVLKYRSLMNHLVFGVPFDPRHLQFDPERGCALITPDKETFNLIGDPNASNLGSFKSTGDNEIDRWKSPFDDVFPPKRAEAKSTEDPFLQQLYDQKSGFGEPAIDAMRKQKDDELEQYRRNASKKKDKKDDA